MKKLFLFFSFIFVVVVFGLLISSCQQVNSENEKAIIQAKMDKVAQAHFEKNATKFYAPNADTWIDIRNGKVELKEKENSIPPTQSYLDNMEFLELKNSHDPIIEISYDGSMASYVGALHVKGRFSGQPVLWIVSWQSVFKKINGDWKIIQTANTDLPQSEMSSVILQQVKTFLGGSEHIDKIETIQTLADCQFEEDKFTTLVFSGKSQTRFEQSDARGTNILASSPTASFQYLPESEKLKNELDTMFKQFIHGHELHWLALHPQSRFHQPVFKGFLKYDEQDAFQVEFTDDLKRPVTFYYAFENYQPLGFKIYTGTMEQGETVSVYFKNWQKQDGVQVFKEAVFKQGEFVFNYDFTKIEMNTLRDEDFIAKEKRIIN